MRDEEYNNCMKEFELYMEPYKKSISDSVTSMGRAILERAICNIAIDKKISERNDKINKLLNE